MVTQPADAVDAIVAQWRAERPDLDPSAKEVTGRLVRLGSLAVAAYATEFRELGLSEGSYGVLVALRRAGAPFELTPTELARQRMMTSGGVPRPSIVSNGVASSSEGPTPRIGAGPSCASPTQARKSSTRR